MPNELRLPDEPVAPLTRFEHAKILIYGEPKWGKTTLASHFPNPFFLMTERGADWLKVKQVVASDFDEFLKYCQLLREKIKKSSSYCDTIVIDTVDNLWNLVMEDECDKLNISHPSELGYGGAYERIAKRIGSLIIKLSNLGPGVLLIGHAKDSEVVIRGRETQQVTAALPPSTFKVIWTIIDVMLCCVTEETSNITEDGELKGVKDERVIHCRASQHIRAGDRTNRLPNKIIMQSEAQAFSEICSYYERETNGKKTTRR